MHPFLLSTTTAQATKVRVSHKDSGIINLSTIVLFMYTCFENQLNKRFLFSFVRFSQTHIKLYCPFWVSKEENLNTIKVIVAQQLYN